MTEETQDLRESLSTLISDAQSGGTGGGTPPPEQPQADEQVDEKASIADVLRKEAKAQEAAAKEDRKAEKAEPAPEAKKEEPKAEPEEKAEAEAPEVEAEKPDEAGEKEAAKAAQSEGKADRIPSRLLPKEREVWANVPNAVKAAWERMEAEHASAAEKYEASAKFHEELREYDEMAKKANTTIKTALDRYVAMDKKIAANFGEGVADIARAFNKNPVEAVAQFMRAAGVLPQQLGAYLQGKPAQPVQPQMQQAQRQPDPVAQQALQKVAHLEQMLQQQQEEAKIAEAERIIDSAKANMPRFDELQNDVAFFLQSGKIPASLSPVERLEVAYDMAERINPAPVKTSPSLAEPAGKPPVSDAGKKSVRGAPASGQSSNADFDDETDLVALLRKEARKLTA